MQPHKKFVFDVGITFIASMISMVLGFIITVVLGRYLGAGELGLYRFVSTIYGIAMLFAAIGIPAAIIKYVAENKGDRRKTNSIVSAGIITSLLFGSGFSLLFFFLSGIFEGVFTMPGLSILLKILSPVFPFALVGGTLLGFMNGLREMKKYCTATILQSVLMLIVSLVLIYQGIGIIGVIIGIVLSSIGSCFYLIMIGRHYFEIVLEGYIQTTKEMILFGIQIFGSNAINMINYQADTIMIGYFLTARDVGFYGAAVGLSIFLWIIPQAIQTITYPANSEYWITKNYFALQTIVDKSMKYSACILLPIGLGVGFFARDILVLIFKESFIQAVLPLQILLVGTIINGVMQRPIGSILYSVGLPNLNFRIFGFAAIANIFLNLLLIPIYGISGAAIATVISYLIITFLILFYIQKRTQVKIDYHWFARTGILTFITILILNIIDKFNYHFSGIVVIFLFSLILLIYISKDDKAFIIDLIKTAKSYFYE